ASNARRHPSGGAAASNDSLADVRRRWLQSRAPNVAQTDVHTGDTPAEARQRATPGDTPAEARQRATTPWPTFDGAGYSHERRTSLNPTFTPATPQPRRGSEQRPATPQRRRGSEQRHLGRRSTALATVTSAERRSNRRSHRRHPSGGAAASNARRHPSGGAAASNDTLADVRRRWLQSRAPNVAQPDVHPGDTPAAARQRATPGDTPAEARQRATTPWPTFDGAGYSHERRTSVKPTFTPATPQRRRGSEQRPATPQRRRGSEQRHLGRRSTALATVTSAERRSTRRSPRRHPSRGAAASNARRHPSGGAAASNDTLADVRRRWLQSRAPNVGQTDVHTGDTPAEAR